MDGHTWEGAVFSGTAIESITLPSTLKRIEEETFRYCKNLKSVEIPNGVEYVGRWCFTNCVLEKITLPATLAIEGAFSDCRLKFMTFTSESKFENIELIGYHGIGTEKIIISKNVTKIRGYAFSRCENLREVIFEEGSKLKIIGESAFSDCKSLKNIQLPDGLEKIGAQCFNGSGLDKLILPSSVKRIEARTFYDCKDLRSVEIPKAVEYIEKECFKDSGIEEIALPSTLKRLEIGTFYNCKNLKSIEIPEGVEYIGDSCFSSSAI